MTIHDHNTQFEDVTVQPGAVDAVSDGLPEVASTTVPPTLRRRLSAGTATGARSIASKYALLVVWAAMALFFYIALPSTFGRVATLQSIFGSQEVLVFLGIAALTTLSVGEFDLSIASIMGIAATTAVSYTHLAGGEPEHRLRDGADRRLPAPGHGRHRGIGVCLQGPGDLC